MCRKFSSFKNQSKKKYKLFEDVNIGLIMAVHIIDLCLHVYFFKIKKNNLKFYFNIKLEMQIDLVNAFPALKSAI